MLLIGMSEILAQPKATEGVPALGLNWVPLRGWDHIPSLFSAQFPGLPSVHT